MRFWRDFNPVGRYGTREYAAAIAAVSRRFVARGGGARDYWLRHGARTGYFFANAALGTVSSQLSERLRRGGDPARGNFASGLARADTVARLVAESCLVYEQDYECIARGAYKRPYDMYKANPQHSPFYVARQTSRFVKEAVGTLQRRNRGSDEDKRVRCRDLEADLYPDYYKTAFHYQTDVRARCPQRRMRQSHISFDLPSLLLARSTLWFSDVTVLVRVG